MVKLRDLEYLDAIAKYRHFGKAAQACFVSQPTLSGQIIKLEEQLGLTLVERQTRKVMLTPMGEQLIEQARRVLQAAEDFQTSAKALLDPLSGDLHLGMIPTLAPYLLPHIMTDLNNELPSINFYLYEDKTQHLLTQLAEGKLDALILPWLDSMDKFERYDLFNEAFVMASPKGHAFAKRESITLKDLADHNILTLEDGHCLRDQAMGYCFSAGANEDQSFRATSLETLRYMVASNMGVTLLPELATLNRTGHEDVYYTRFQQPEPNRQISLLIRPGYSRMACIRKVVTCVKNSMASFKI
ncbi:DNA-binding transcriptional regulator OxyR [Thalassotalea insulae]|uniref:DNA-binding transcriptional regulator OxyR n=1 Tax=Thalassotalea insulae TaxID=2056778 RepID=A0ABQ6H0Y4_9GAMM|nr:DNA-binding transcriptional regulator OxyR [Thalassotalea insulae]GLX80091.1 DNA-binding transcriptional regulator OxyR [Thalassotalea insulae]